MTKRSLVFLTFFLPLFSVSSQEINTDELYLKALEAYQQGDYRTSLELTNTGVAAAPAYHDIRILRVRNKFALGRAVETNGDLIFLLSAAPAYEGVKNIALQRLYEMSPIDAVSFSSQLLEVYPKDASILIYKSGLVLKQGELKQARELALLAYEANDLTNSQRYALSQLLALTTRNAVQVNGQYINFSENYSRNDSWYTLSAEYQHNFPKLALIGRANYVDRSYTSGSFFEVEAYPVISEKVYAFTNLGFSDGSIFPNLRASTSLFYNFATSFEAEGGFRSLFYEETSFFSGIIGLTAYTGRFYLNARAFVGPQRQEQLLQNYQFNVRYYLNNPENFLFGRIGTGFSPDEPSVYTQNQLNPTLEALYFSAGINKSFGIHHVISLSGGMLSEDLPGDKKGHQITAALGYRYKF